MFEQIKGNPNEKLFYDSIVNLKEHFIGREGYEWFVDELNTSSDLLDDKVKERLSSVNNLSLIRLNEISKNEKETTLIETIDNYLKGEKKVEKKYTSDSEKIIRFMLLSEYLLNNGKETVCIDNKKWNKYLANNELEDEIFSNFLEIIKGKYNNKNEWKFEDIKEVFNSFYKENTTLEKIYSLLDTKKVFEL